MHIETCIYILLSMSQWGDVLGEIFLNKTETMKLKIYILDKTI